MNKLEIYRKPMSEEQKKVAAERLSKARQDTLKVSENDPETI